MAIQVVIDLLTIGLEPESTFLTRDCLRIRNAWAGIRDAFCFSISHVLIC
jgi:hypothetical protein